MRKLENAIALVTSSTRGIGLACAKKLASEGAIVYMGVRRLEVTQEICDEVAKEGLKMKPVFFDAYNIGSYETMVEEVIREQGKIDILVNNAGFGVFGEFSKTDLGTEINLINTNITAVHILTKLYLQDMIKKNKGHILNVASIAGMEPGPLMAAYYASKAYVIRLSRAINKELKKDKSNVKISILCPGPTNTNFNNVANVVFKSPSMSSEKVAKYGIDKTLQGKLIIVPGILNKSVRLFSKIVPDSILETCAYHIQRRKRKQEK